MGTKDNTTVLTQFIKPALIFLLGISVLVGLSFLRNHLQNKAKQLIENDATFAPDVDENNILRKKFTEIFPDRTIILACTEDINNDAIKDLVVISQKEKNIETIALLDLGNGNYITTEAIPAPVENQYIKFFDMDKVGAFEILITGEKKGQVGYAIYTYKEQKLINIFGEGMEDCC